MSKEAIPATSSEVMLASPAMISLVHTAPVARSSDRATGVNRGQRNKVRERDRSGRVETVSPRGGAAAAVRPSSATQGCNCQECCVPVDPMQRMREGGPRHQRRPTRHTAAMPNSLILRSSNLQSETHLLTYLLRTFTVRRERTWPKRTVSGRTCTCPI